MSLDLPLAVAAFGIGGVVGLTGMGGGALMTPVLVLFFDVLPLTAVSSDLVASAVMKPVGSIVHLRRGTVHLALVKWLCVGSIPSAFAGVLIARASGGGEEVQEVIRTALAIARRVHAEYRTDPAGRDHRGTAAVDGGAASPWLSPRWPSAAVRTSEL